MTGYTNSNREGCVEDKKITFGCCSRLGSTIVSWFHWKQRLVALSSDEATYMAASQAKYDAIWIHKLLVGLFGQQLWPTVIYCNNQSLKLTKNLVFYDSLKIIKMKYHFV